LAGVAALTAAFGADRSWVTLRSLFGPGPSARAGNQKRRKSRCSPAASVFDSAAAGGVVFYALTMLDASVIAEVQTQVRRRLLHTFVRRGLRPVVTHGRWRNGRIHRSPWND
jgi:hypothetical protein